MRITIVFLLTVLFSPALAGLVPEDTWLRGEALESLEGLTLLEVRLEGNLRTRDATVLRELSFFPGEAFDREQLAEDLRFLDGLGLFLRTGARARRVDGGVELVLDLEERSRASNEYIYPMLDFDEELRWRAGLAYRNRNLNGNRDELRMSGTQGWEDSIRFSLLRPWVGGRPLEHFFSYSYQELDVDDVDYFRQNGGGASILFPLNRRRPRLHRFLLGANISWRLQREEAGSWEEQFVGISLGYFHDDRDSFIRPRCGERFGIRVDLYQPSLGSTHSLRRWSIFAAHYKSLGGFGVLAGNVQVGLQEGELYHRMVWSLGGFNRVRGWDSGYFNGWDGHDEPGGAQGRNSALFQLEWRGTLFGQQRWQLTRWWVLDFEGEVLLFLDGGMLWRNGLPWEEGIAGDRALGFGGGLRIYSPLGDVLRLELGITPEGRAEVHLGNVIPF